MPAKSGPPRPSAPSANSDTSGDTRLTATQAWAIYSGVVGYHLPRHLANATRILQAIGPRG